MEETKKSIDLVGEFHRAFGVVELEAPGMPDDRTVLVRIQLITEEISELAKALAAQDEVQVLDALCDLQYVIDGTYRTFGYNKNVRNDYQRFYCVVGISNREISRAVLMGLLRFMADFTETFCIDALDGLQKELDGAWYLFGFEPVREAAFAEVHASNMTKLGADGRPVIHASGRVEKGPNFRKPDLEQFIVKTSYFSFGQGHVHTVNGKIFDRDCLVKITAKDPRQVMFDTFGSKWAMEYKGKDLADVLRHFPRGVVEL